MQQENQFSLFPALADGGLPARAITSKKAGNSSSDGLTPDQRYRIKHAARLKDKRLKRYAEKRLEIQARQRENNHRFRLEHPEEWESQQQAKRERAKAKYHNDPVYRTAFLEKCRLARLNNLERVRAKDRERSRKRWQNESYRSAIAERVKREKPWRKLPVIVRRERFRAWAAKNKESRNADHAEWKKHNPARMAANRRRYRLKHHAKVLAYNKQYAKDHPEWVRNNVIVTQAKRRAAKLNAASDPRWIKEFYIHVRTAKIVYCYYCQNPVQKENKQRQVDHVFPLTRNGPHAVWNLCSACQPCNTSKNQKTLAEWNRVRIGQLFLCL